MVVMILPKWFDEAQKEIKEAVFKISQEQNIDWRFISDSESINDSIASIAHKLLFFKEQTRGAFTEEELKQLKKIEKAEKKK